MKGTSDIELTFEASEWRGGYSLIIKALKVAFTFASKARICPTYIKYVLGFVFIFTYAHAQVDGIYQLEKKGQRFELILCDGKFSFFLISKKILKVKDKPSCIHYVKRNSTKPHGSYQINKDTLKLTDSKFGNRYNFIISSEELVPIRPNYTFLVKFNKPLKKADSDSIFLSKCFNNRYERVQVSREWFDIDTISKHTPEKKYGRKGGIITFGKSKIRVKLGGFVFYEGNYRIENKRILFYSNDMQKELVIHFGVKSYKDLVLDMDPLLNMRSFPKKYTQKQWHNVIDTAKEFNMGARGAGPNFEKIKE